MHNGITPGGDRIVGLGHVSASRFRGYVITRAGFSFLDVPGAASTEPQDINPRATIVGLYFDSVFQRVRGFVLDASGFTSIDGPGARGTNARSINPLGQIVGGWTDANGSIHAYILSR